MTSIYAYCHQPCLSSLGRSSFCSEETHFCMVAANGQLNNMLMEVQYQTKSSVVHSGSHSVLLAMKKE